MSYDRFNTCARCDHKGIVYSVGSENLYCHRCCELYMLACRNKHFMPLFHAFVANEEFRQGDSVEIYPHMHHAFFYEEGVDVHHVLMYGEIVQFDKQLVYKRRK